MNIKNEVLIRVYVVLFFVVLAGLVLLVQTIKVGVVEGDKWREKGNNLYVEYKPVEAERGNVLAEDGSLLATSLPFFEIRFDPNSSGMKAEDFEVNIDSLAYCLATFVDNSYTVGGMRDRLIAEKEAGARNILIKRNANYLEKEMMSKFPLFSKGQFKGGFIVSPRPKRVHPFKQLGYRTIGYVKEGHNPVGLEGFYNETLAGEAGKQLMFRAPNNTWIPVNDLTEIEPKRGDDIVTTMDVNLQDITHEALLRGLQYHNADHGTAVLMEVETGAIKAISNIGKTEKGWFEIYNYAVGAATEPGSTYKLASILALLEDGYVDLEDSISIENGKTMFYEEEMVDATKASFKMDTTTIRTAFEISSNVGIAKLVQKYYGDTNKEAEFIKRLKEMRLNLPVGIEIKGEASPYIKEANSEEDDWSGITLPWMSIGYEVTITPLQMLNLYNTVANDGVMMKPYLVAGVRHFDETVEKIKPTVVKRKIASKETIQKAQELLLGVVERGTAHKLKSEDYQFAGKTGTAQVNYRRFNLKQANLRYQASFAGYFPAENPKYSCIVVITNPRENGFYGGDVAGPVFREIADKCFATRIELHDVLNTRARSALANNKLPDFDAGLKKDLEKVMKNVGLDYEAAAETEWAIVHAENDTLSLLNRTISDDVVPVVTGMGLKDALFILENRGLKVIVSGSGKVRNQSILAGTKIRGQTIRLTLR